MNDNCAICLDKLDINKKYILNCSHSFHIDCIIEVFRRGDGKCPICRDNPYNSDSDCSQSESESELLEIIQRHRMGIIRERQGIAQRIPKIKKLQIKFRKYKKEYFQTKKIFRKQLIKLRKKYNIDYKRRMLWKSFQKYINTCIDNRKHHPGEPFDMYESPFNYNT